MLDYFVIIYAVEIFLANNIFFESIKYIFCEMKKKMRAFM